MNSSMHARRWRLAAALMMLLSTLLAACGESTGEQGAATAAPDNAGVTTVPGSAIEPTRAAETETEAVPTLAPAAGVETETAAAEETAASADETATTAETAGADETSTAMTGATAGADETATAAGASETATAAGAAGGGATAAGPTLNADVSGNVEFWHFWGSPVRRNAIRRVVAICQQQLPNITVNETFKPFGDIWTAKTAAVAAGSGMPDVIVEDRPKLPALAADNIHQNLQDLATRDGLDGSRFWPFTWNQTLYEDDTYGIPFETDVRVLYWNKNAFREAGLDPEKPPKTWAELEEYAEKLDKKNEDGSYERIAFSPLIGNVGPEVWGYTNGVEWITEDGEVAINTPQAVETLEWIKMWLDRYGGFQNHQNFRANFAAAPNDAFMSGSVAMYVDINGYTSQLNFFRPQVENAEGERENLDWGVSDIPYKEEQASTSGGFALSIPRGAPNADAAWEFIKCATGEEAQASWARDTYAMPANMAAAKDPVLLADPNWQFFVDAMSYSEGGVFLQAYPNWGQELGNRYEQVWTGAMEPEAMLAEAEQVIEAEIGE